MNKIIYKINRTLYDWHRFDLRHYMDLSVKAIKFKDKEYFLKCSEHAIKTGKRVLELEDKLNFSTTVSRELSVIEDIYKYLKSKQI